MASTIPQSTLRRLNSDLKELQKSPIPGANAYPLSNNILEWHANIVGTASIKSQ
jgi:ubiquitin-protein ligase